MPDLRMTIEDVLASCDVLRDVQEASDSMTPEECIEYRIACEAVARAAADAIALCNMQFIKMAEQDVVMDGRRFYVGRKKDRVRFDHDKIAGKVVTAAVDGAIGAVTPAKAAAQAVDLMSKIYLSDSTTAKVGALAALGLNTDRDNPTSVRTWEKGEKIVVAIPAGGET